MFFFYFFFYFFVSSGIWLAKRSSCPAISGNWASTRLASITVFLILVCFLFYPFFFSFQFLLFSFNFLFNFLFPFSIEMAARQLLTSISSSGDSCKNKEPTHNNVLLLTYLTPVYTIIKYDELILQNYNHSILTKMLKALSRQELRKQSRKQVRGGEVRWMQ